MQSIHETKPGEKEVENFAVCTMEDSTVKSEDLSDYEQYGQEKEAYTVLKEIAKEYIKDNHIPL